MTMRVLALSCAAVLVLSACEGFDRNGQWHEGIPSISGYYVDPINSCIKVGQVNNGMSGTHALELVQRVDAGERMCDKADEITLSVARRVITYDRTLASRDQAKDRAAAAR